MPSTDIPPVSAPVKLKGKSAAPGDEPQQTEGSTSSDNSQTRLYGDETTTTQIDEETALVNTAQGSFMDPPMRVTYPKYAMPSFLAPGSMFIGSQQSGQSTYEVRVQIKSVDMENAFMCGYLWIEGLTEDNPTITTYFYGEMISEKNSFFTKQADWGASAKTDISHWSRFQPWRMISNEAKEPNYVHKNFEQQDHIFMRWKERFLIPDHRVRDINGASYAGFYYICFDQVNGSISGFYYHKRSDNFQQLELTHVPDSGCSETFEFR
ncbi:hypothetical protein TRVA0_001S06304 [Trichomonascus vanleenenianus]|uniref:glucose-induced degradation complex subunit VID24 n=1 Tax=Trichomonascus vanleenenianus TaxID=2268995 RepID=UPI003EC97352